MNVKVKVNVNEMVNRKLGRAASMRPPEMSLVRMDLSTQARSSSAPHLGFHWRILNTARRDVGPYLYWES